MRQAFYVIIDIPEQNEIKVVLQEHDIKTALVKGLKYPPYQSEISVEEIPQHKIDTVVW
jgi:hypothetical protein